MKIRFRDPHIWNGEYVQPFTADGTGGYGPIEVSPSELEGLRLSGTAFVEHVEKVPDEEQPKTVTRYTRNPRVITKS